MPPSLPMSSCDASASSSSASAAAPSSSTTSISRSHSSSSSSAASLGTIGSRSSPPTVSSEAVALDESLPLACGSSAPSGCAATRRTLTEERCSTCSRNHTNCGLECAMAASHRSRMSKQHLKRDIFSDSSLAEDAGMLSAVLIARTTCFIERRPSSEQQKMPKEKACRWRRYLATSSTRADLPSPRIPETMVSCFCRHERMSRWISSCLPTKPPPWASCSSSAAMSESLGAVASSSSLPMKGRLHGHCLRETSFSSPNGGSGRTGSCVAPASASSITKQPPPAIGVADSRCCCALSKAICARSPRSNAS
mmetsp:Transcript_32401/g.75544  ORF Transcript_32401/g.75544 Transcript_32401/m.75544 type:complete len:310 (-) Transcript_32401:180-1109(-)